MAGHDQYREKMMRLRLHSMIAVLSAMLLLPILARTQEPPAVAPPLQTQASPEEGQAPSQEKMPEGPVEPILSGPYPVMSAAAEERGRQLFEMFNHTQTSDMWAALSDSLRKRSGKQERFAEINKRLREHIGPETSLIEETIVPSLIAPDTIYARLSNFSDMTVPIVSMINVNQRGQIDGFDIHPLPRVAEGQYAGYKDTTKLHLPFQGEWLVYQGGRNAFDNPYAVSDDTRFSVDFVPLKDGRAFSGAGGLGSKNEDYYCFGQPILAPADGTVIRAISGYDDNPPGQPSGDPSEGNMVIISHAPGEQSVFTHLKQNSLRVKRDDKVKQGEVIAECGNSGAGPVPHVHYQLQKSLGVPLPAQFVDYIADGKPVASGEPKRGQFVKNAPTPAAATAAPAESPAKAK